MDDGSLLRSGSETWGPVSPDNVHETGVSPGGQSGSPIVAAEAEQVERTRRKTWSRARSEVFVPYSLHFTSSTRNPSGEFVAQQARNLAVDGELEGVTSLIRDRDSKYTGAFDGVFISEGARVIKTPVRAPKANGFAERFVRTVRHEVLDLTLVLGRRHLDRILRRYAEHYNAQRPHRGLDLRTPAGTPEWPISAELPGVRRIDVLCGLIHEYEAVAA